MQTYIKILLTLIPLVSLTSVTNYYSSTVNKDDTISKESQSQSITKKEVDAIKETMPFADSIIGNYKLSKEPCNSENFLKTTVPIVSKRFYKRHQIKHIKHRIERIYSKYGDYIKKASALTQVPENLIVSIIFIESNGHERSLNKKSGATGLMQLTQSSCSDILYLKNKMGQLTQIEKHIIKKSLGNRLDCILGMQHMGQKKLCNGKTGFNVSEEDLYNPEFNILCGAIFLSVLIENHTEKGLVRLDKIVAGYSVGLFSKIKGKTPEEVMQYTNKETRSYIEKLAGTNGVLRVMSI